MTGSAYADHVVEHAVENLKVGLGALEQRIFDSEHGIGGACPGTEGPQGGPQGDPGPQGLQGEPGPAPDLSLIQAQLDNLALLASRQASAFIFVSSTTSTGNLGGVGGADDTCNALANGAGLPGVYMAWLATTDADDPAETCDQAPGPYILPNGDLVANDWADLTDGFLINPIDVDENGTEDIVAGVWTNVAPGGVVKDGSGQGDCDGWTEGTNAFSGELRGTRNTRFLRGTDRARAGCATQLRLYCVGQ